MKVGQWVEIWNYGDRQGWMRVLHATRRIFNVGPYSFWQKNGRNVRNPLIRAYPCAPLEGAQSHLVRARGYRYMKRAGEITDRLLAHVLSSPPMGIEADYLPTFLERYRVLIEVRVAEQLFEDLERRGVLSFKHGGLGFHRELEPPVLRGL